jgi:tetratricopeptide (TPR) repeat protein
VFAPDGKLMAVETTTSLIRLVDSATGREIARLEDPYSERPHTWMGFTPDGTQLVAVSQSARAIRVWDLRAIRRQLKERGLDWDWPEFAPAGPEGGRLLEVQVDSGEVGALSQAQGFRQQAQGHVQARQWEQAIAAYARAIALQPRSAGDRNHLAWVLATCPDEKFRDAGRSLELARKAVELEPGVGDHWYTLSVAHLRTGAWQDAIDAQTKAMKLYGGVNAFDWFVLAMAHWQLGHTEAARTFYGQAVQWMDKHQPDRDELRGFRAEAGQLLGVKEK